jgi:hypothetical protein
MDSKGLAVQLTDPAFSDVAYRQSDSTRCRSWWSASSWSRTHDAYHEGQAAGLPIGVLNAPEGPVRRRAPAGPEFFGTSSTRASARLSLSGPI